MPSLKEVRSRIVSVNSTKQITAALQYGYPITEYQGVQWGVAANQSELVTAQGSSAQQAIAWVRHNGNSYDRLIGDTNGDGTVNVSDVFYTINTLFAGGPPSSGDADVNNDGVVNVADVFYLINYLFAGGPAPM